MDVSLDAGITYTGSVYLLPYQRGIVLEELEVADRLGATAVSLEELLESLLGGVGRYRLDIRVTPQRRPQAGPLGPGERGWMRKALDRRDPRLILWRLRR